MGLSVNTFIIAGIEKESATLPPSPPPPPVETVADVKARASKKKTKMNVEDIKEPSVVIDGKVKKISKKSAYLIDMLTLDD